MLTTHLHLRPRLKIVIQGDSVARGPKLLSINSLGPLATESPCTLTLLFPPPNALTVCRGITLCISCSASTPLDTSQRVSIKSNNGSIII